MKLRQGTTAFCAVLEDGPETSQAITIAENIRRWHQEQAERARALERARNAEKLARIRRGGREFIGRAVARAFEGITL